MHPPVVTGYIPVTRGWAGELRTGTGSNNRSVTSPAATGRLPGAGPFLPGGGHPLLPFRGRGQRSRPGAALPPAPRLLVHGGPEEAGHCGGSPSFTLDPASICWRSSSWGVATAARRSVGVPSAMRTRRSQVVFPVTDEIPSRRPVAGEPRHPSGWNRVLHADSALARGEVLGAITYVSPNPGDSFTRRDLVLGEDLAARVAIAIENSRLMLQAKHALAAAELSKSASRGHLHRRRSIISVDETQSSSSTRGGAHLRYGKREIMASRSPCSSPSASGRARRARPRVRRVPRRRAADGAPARDRRAPQERREFPAEASTPSWGGRAGVHGVLRDMTKARNAALARRKLLLAVTHATEARTRCSA